MNRNGRNWQRMWFKGNKVWAAVDPEGALRVADGKVLIKYRLDQDYEYRVHRRHLSPLDQPPPAAAPRGTPAHPPAPGKRCEKAPKQTARPLAKVDEPADAIRIYTDGASTGNPGPSGIGVVMCHGEQRREISEPIGWTTNNVAELRAIQAGLMAVRKRRLPVRLYTDSSYAYGLLSLGWKPKKNQELVAAIRALAKEFSDLKFIKVRGHAGHEGNERADFLATSAARSGGEAARGRS